MLFIYLNRCSSIECLCHPVLAIDLGDKNGEVPGRLTAIKQLLRRTLVPHKTHEHFSDNPLR